MTTLCARCEQPLHQAPPASCSALPVHRAAAVELGRLGLELAEARARLEAYAECEVDHDSRCAAYYAIDSAKPADCDCGLRVADPALCSARRAQAEQAALDRSAVGHACLRCDEVINAWRGAPVQREGDRFVCGDCLRRAAREGLVQP
jgi:hypothetical protein